MTPFTVEAFRIKDASLSQINGLHEAPSAAGKYLGCRTLFVTSPSHAKLSFSLFATACVFESAWIVAFLVRCLSSFQIFCYLSFVSPGLVD